MTLISYILGRITVRIRTLYTKKAPIHSVTQPPSLTYLLIQFITSPTLHPLPSSSPLQPSIPYPVHHLSNSPSLTQFITSPSLHPLPSSSPLQPSIPYPVHQLSNPPSFTQFITSPTLHPLPSSSPLHPSILYPVHHLSNPLSLTQFITSPMISMHYHKHRQ